jgi:hypothetical protein
MRLWRKLDNIHTMLPTNHGPRLAKTIGNGFGARIFLEWAGTLLPIQEQWSSAQRASTETIERTTAR